MNSQQPWPWFLALENWLHKLRELWVKLFRQKPTILAYVGYGSETQVRILARTVYTGKRERKDPNSRIRGWRSFLAVPYRGATVRITAANQDFYTTSDEGGFIDQLIHVDLPTGWNYILLQLENGAKIKAPVQIIDQQVKFGILSDIDDTIMVTSLAHPLLALWNTFLLEDHARDAVSGMPVLYERLKNRYPDAPFIYLSTGAWNVAPTHQRFMARNLFPIGPMLLTDWGTSSERWFRSGKEHKQQNLERLMHEFPHMRWLLIGDDGEHDPERYHEIASRYPERIQAIVIRKLGNDQVKWEQPSEQNSPDTVQINSVDTASAPLVVWVFGHDGSAISTQLQSLKIL